MAANSPYYDGTSNHFEPMFPMGPDFISANEERAGYINSNIHHCVAGAMHGGIDLFTHQIAGIASICCTAGAHEWDDPVVDRLFSTMAFAQSQSAYLNQFDDWLMHSLDVDPDNLAYQNTRYYTTAAIEVGSLAIGGYSLIKGGIKVVNLCRLPPSLEGAKFAGSLALKELKYAVSNGAENVNAGVYLSKKLSQLERVQETAATTRVLSDGRIRYYLAERPSYFPGPTRGSAYVMEYHPSTSYVRGWNECYDYSGKVNRVHPKNINGQNLFSQHYPLTAKELKQ